MANNLILGDKNSPLSPTKTALDLLSNLEPLEYLVENLIIKNRLYTLTARNNHGKNTIASLLMAAVSTGSKFSGLRTEKSRILFLSGENTYDALLKLEILAGDIDLSMIDIYEGAFDMKNNKATFCNSNIEYGLVIVDSNQSFFGDGDMNGNSDPLAHAQALRRISNLPGNPAVLVLSHPTKNASRDDLNPYGGGSFLNEIDGNITLWLDGDIGVLHHKKLRQPSFEEITFRLSVLEVPGRITNFGSSVTTTRFWHIDIDTAEAIKLSDHEEKVKCMQILNGFGGSKSHLAREIFGSDDAKYMSKVQRIVSALRTTGFMEQEGKYRLSKKGKDYIEHC